MRVMDVSAQSTRARRLRRDQTDARKFRRQLPIGGYFADFACVAAKLIIELDGGQHGERTIEDAQRTEAFERLGQRENEAVRRFRYRNDVFHGKGRQNP